MEGRRDGEGDRVDHFDQLRQDWPSAVVCSCCYMILTLVVGGHNMTLIDRDVDGHTCSRPLVCRSWFPSLACLHLLPCQNPRKQNHHLFGPVLM